MYSPVVRSLHMIASLVALSVAASSMASAQMGMGGGGYGGGAYRDLEIAILLGSDFDAQKEVPFTDAYELSTDPGLANRGIQIAPGNVSIDTTTELPTEPGISVQVYYPKSLKPDELTEFQKRVKLDALRYGLTKVEYTAKEAERVFIRVGLPGGQLNGLDFRKLIAAARDLGSYNPNYNPRLELYAARLSHDPFDSSTASADPFGGGDSPFGGAPSDPFDVTDKGATDPFGTGKSDAKRWPNGHRPPGSTDPFGSAGESYADNNPFDDSDDARGRSDDPFGDNERPPVDPIQTAEAKIKQLHTLQQRLTREIESTITEHNSSKDAAQAAELKSRLVKLVGSLFDSRQQLQANELSLMRLKLSATEALLRSRGAQRASIVGRRVDALLQPEPHKYETH